MTMNRVLTVGSKNPCVNVLGIPLQWIVTNRLHPNNPENIAHHQRFDPSQSNTWPWCSPPCLPIPVPGSQEYHLSARAGFPMVTRNIGEIVDFGSKADGSWMVHGLTMEPAKKCTSKLLYPWSLSGTQQWATDRIEDSSQA